MSGKMLSLIEKSKMFWMSLSLLPYRKKVMEWMNTAPYWFNR